MRRSRMLVPLIVFAAAGAVTAFTLLDGDEVPIIDTSGIDTSETSPARPSEAAVPRRRNERSAAPGRRAPEH